MPEEVGPDGHSAEQHNAHEAIHDPIAIIKDSKEARERLEGEEGLFVETVLASIRHAADEGHSVSEVDIRQNALFQLENGMFFNAPKGTDEEEYKKRMVELAVNTLLHPPEPEATDGQRTIPKAADTNHDVHEFAFDLAGAMDRLAETEPTQKPADMVEGEVHEIANQDETPAEHIPETVDEEFDNLAIEMVHDEDHEIANDGEATPVVEPEFATTQSDDEQESSPEVEKKTERKFSREPFPDLGKYINEVQKRLAELDEDDEMFDDIRTTARLVMQGVFGGRGTDLPQPSEDSINFLISMATTTHLKEKYDIPRHHKYKDYEIDGETIENERIILRDRMREVFIPEMDDKNSDPPTQEGETEPDLSDYEVIKEPEQRFKLHMPSGEEHLILDYYMNRNDTTKAAFLLEGMDRPMTMEELHQRGYEILPDDSPAPEREKTTSPEKEHSLEGHFVTFKGEKRRILGMKEGQILDIEGLGDVHMQDLFAAHARFSTVEAEEASEEPTSTDETVSSEPGPVLEMTPDSTSEEPPESHAAPSVESDMEGDNTTGVTLPTQREKRVIQKGKDDGRGGSPWGNEEKTSQKQRVFRGNNYPEAKRRPSDDILYEVQLDGKKGETFRFRRVPGTFGDRARIALVDENGNFIEVDEAGNFNDSPPGLLLKDIQAENDAIRAFNQEEREKASEEGRKPEYKPIEKIVKKLNPKDKQEAENE